jgi:hypothetical protein
MSAQKVAPKVSIIALSLFGVFLSSSVICSETTIAAPQAKAPAKSAPPVKRPPSVNNSAALTGYWNRLRVRLQNNWQVPDGKNTVVLTANVAADGASSDMVTEGHPKDPQAEVSAAEAFNKSLPLEALPQGVASAKITVNFEYQYDPHGDGYSKVSGQISQVAAQTTAQPAAGAAQSEGAKF